MGKNIKDFNELEKLINSFALTKVQATKLNRAAAVAMRKYVKSRFTKAQDIHGKRFRPRQKETTHTAASGKISLNKKMFVAASKRLKTQADDENASVGWADGRRLRKHNEGMRVKFYNAKYGRKVEYTMPKREFLGWSPEMVKEIEQAIIDTYIGQIKS